MLTSFLNKFVKSKVYFTVETGQQGFTDQMMQLSAFYKLGRAAGFEYHHTRFVSTRSNPLVTSEKEAYDDIYDFLGITDYFSGFNRGEFESDDVFEVNLSDAIVERENIQNFKALVQYVQKSVANALKEKESDAPKLFILRLERARPAPGKGKRQFFSLINASSKANKFSIGFKEIYNQHRAKKPFINNLNFDKTNVLIHIRQGDTAVVKTPWNAYIPVDKRRPDYLTENHRLEDITERYFDKFVDSIFTPEDYYTFWTSLAPYIQNDIQLKVFSDGYQRAIDAILNGGRLLPLTEKQKHKLTAQKSNIDSDSFQCFHRLAYAECAVGETAQSLYQLVDSALRTDIIITAAQQRMLPKLIANYMPTGKPHVIVLYRNVMPDYSDITGADTSRFIYVNIDQPDFHYIVARLKET